jgi:hypothetical protein
LGRDRVELETLLEGPERVIFCTPSGKAARQLADMFSEAGAEIRLIKPEDPRPGEAPEQPIASPESLKPAVPASFGQHIWLLRAALVLGIILALSGFAFLLVLAAFLTLLLSYDWLLSLIPAPALLLPVYLTLALFHLLIIGALVKPFVRIESRLPHTIKLERANERALFDFLVHICDVIKVPYPRAIHVDMSPMIKTGLRPRSELTIGLPVIASFNSAELGGLVARALTLHIGGVSGILGRFVVGTVEQLNGAVHGRDLVDQALEHGLHANNRALLFGARGLSRLLQISRWILAMLLKEAVGTSAAAMQAVEAHKDRHQTRIIGAERFATNLRLMRLLQLAFAHTDEALRKSWQQGRPLPHDLPAALKLRMKAFGSPENLPKAMTLAERDQERVPQFHIPDAKRIEHILKSGIEPAVADTTPARSMVRGFAVLSRRLTMLHYWNQLGLPVTTAQLQVRPAVEQPVLESFTGPVSIDLIPITPGRFRESGKTASALIATAQILKKATPASSEKAQQLLSRYSELEHSLIESMREVVLLRSKKRATKRAIAELERVQERCRTLEESLEKAYGGLAAHGEVISRRLASGIALLQLPETGQCLRGASALAVQATSLAEVLGKIDHQMVNMREMGINLSLLEILLAQSTHEVESALKDRILEQEADIGTRLTGTRVALMLVNNPLQQTKSNVFDDALADWHPTSSRYKVLDESSAVIDGLLRLKRRIIARLAALTKAAEDAWEKSGLMQ